MADITCERVARNVRSPFVLGSVCAADTDETSLESFELLLSTEFVGHGRGVKSGKVSVL